MPLRDCCAARLTGTPLSLVNDEAVDGTFIGDAEGSHDASGARGGAVSARPRLRRAGNAHPGVSAKGVDAAVQRELRERAAGVAAQASEARFRPSSPQAPAAELSTSSNPTCSTSWKGVQALLSASGRMHVDRSAGLVQVTDFADRLDQVGVYVEAVQLRAMRQVRIEAHVFEVDASPTRRRPRSTGRRWRPGSARRSAAAVGRRGRHRVDGYRRVEEGDRGAGHRDDDCGAAGRGDEQRAGRHARRHAGRLLHDRVAARSGGRRQRTSTPVACSKA